MTKTLQESSVYLVIFFNELDFSNLFFFEQQAYIIEYFYFNTLYCKMLIFTFTMLLKHN